MQVRRRNPCLIDINDTLVPDLSALLRGQAQLDTAITLSLLCPIAGRKLHLSADEMRVIVHLSANQWHDLADVVDMSGLPATAIISMADRQLICSDSNDEGAIRLRDAEARLMSIGWHPLAAIYHALSRWEGVIGTEGARDHGDPAQLERLHSHVAKHGEVPSHFHARSDTLDRTRLPSESLDDGFAHVLRARCTTRHFRDGTLPLQEFTRVLYGTFGTTGTESLGPGMVAIKRTSPSGGALHPIEAYPLVMAVQGLTPGLYHYETGSHTMALLEPMTTKQARGLAAAFTVGQTYFAEAQAMVFHAARMDRHHWKYRDHPKAYKAVMLDSGHLSQTFYLLAAERGLGAFYTAAINDGDIAKRLRLDPLSEVVIGANGLGLIDPVLGHLNLQPEAYEPS